ncbi:MAG: hypothetical protein QM774_06625 [Gordonia sp. (in: high G+C Gram-positive bacteria)]|uniref:hypothetical protein n=1 Tax=Gordonia sp. (in: high G+C Gram-positive bacteria) TaxID=84139 RepID=UPI0039E2DF74
MPQPRPSAAGANFRELAATSSSLAADIAARSSEGLGKLRASMGKALLHRNIQRNWDLLNRGLGMAQQDPPQAFALCSESLNGFRALASEDPDIGIRVGMADSLAGMADLTPDHRAKVSMRRELVALLTELTLENQGDPQLQFRLANSSDKLGALITGEAPADALMLHRRALTLWQTLVKSNDPVARRSLSSCLVRIANLTQADDPAASRRMLTDALNLRLRLRQEAPMDPARVADVTAATGFLNAFADSAESRANEQTDTAQADLLRREATAARRAVSTASTPVTSGPQRMPVPPGPPGQHRR